MRRIAFATAFALGIALVPSVVTAAESQLRYTISVSKFENRSGNQWYWGPKDLGDAWGVVMTDILQQSGHFIVLGEADMRAEAMAEQDLASSGATAQGSRTPVSGQMTPAQLLVKGAITHTQASTTGGGGKVRVKGFKVGGSKDTAVVNATIYLVDSTTGQVVASTSVVGESNRTTATFGYAGHDFGVDTTLFKNGNRGKAVEAAVDEAVGWLIKQLPGIPWTGTVALVKDGSVYINRGERDGVVRGQEFVVGQVDVIRDPETGEVLDESMNEVATVSAQEVREKLTICSVTNGDAGDIERGMKVHLP